MKLKKSLKKVLALGLCASIVGSTAITVNANKVEDAKTSRTVEEKKSNGLTVTEQLIDEGTEWEFMLYNYDYKGMTEKEFKDAGLHIAVSYSQDGKEWGRWQDLAAYAFNFGDYANYGGCVRFAVVDYAMDDTFFYKDDLSKSDKTMALSDAFYYNVEKEWKVAPSLVELTPSNQRVHEPGKYKVTAKINDHLIQTGELDVETSFSRGTGLKAEVSNVKIENKVEDSLFNGTRNVSLVTFDLKTDETYNAHFSDTIFQIKGAVGAESEMEVMPFGLTTAFTPKVYCHNGAFEGVMITEECKDRIINFNVDKFEYAPMTEHDAKIVIAKTKNGKTTGNRLNLNCESDVAKFDTCKKISVGVKFVDGFDKDASYKAYRYTKQADGTFKAEELKTEINAKGLRVFN